MLVPQGSCIPVQTEHKDCMLADLRRTVYEVSCPSLYDVMTGMLVPSHVVVYCRRGVSDWLYP